MLRFEVFRDGKALEQLDLSTAYLSGSDNIPVRGDIVFDNGVIHCRKRAGGPASLSLLWPVEGFGQIILETTRLPERDAPYNLNLELARGRMMRFVQKREDWGFLDQAETQAIADRFNESREVFVQALSVMENGAEASRLADRCLENLLPLSEHAATVHADLLLPRRINARGFSRNVFGCRIDLAEANENYRRTLVQAADFVYVPLVWRQLQPEEQILYWQQPDEWFDFLRRQRLPALAGPLVQFTEASLPPWLYIYENDFEALRDFLYEHIDRMVNRYAGHVALWNVASGLHVNTQFGFTFDQIMDLTRMSLALVKKVSPHCRTMVELTQPWGEYYATNQRSIPPLVYAEMAVQSAGAFDVFGLQLCFGVPREGLWQRDLMQISALLDRFAGFGKPLMISAMAVPSQETPGVHAGQWRKPWNEIVQAKWLQVVSNVALSKPFVEAICWNSLTDPKEGGIPNSGLAAADYTPKAAMKTWTSLRRGVSVARQSAGRAASGQASS